VVDGFYAGVVIDRSSSALDRVFHYEVPDEFKDRVKLGMRVLVPFGQSMVQGYIISLDEATDIPEHKLKAIKKLMDPYPLISEKFIPLIMWVKKEYHCPLIEAIHCFVPPGIRVNIKEKKQKVAYLSPEYAEKAETAGKLSANMKAILQALEQEDGLPVKELLINTGASQSSINSLVSKGLITVETEETYRNPWQYEIDATQPPVYNDEQNKAISLICSMMSKGGGTVLLHGVTGSGKTEVYMKTSAEALAMDKQVIVLVPEISLTPQTVGRFKSRFGDRVAVLHSRLSIGERYDEWRRIYNNKVDIVVGARSAIFAPLNRLGLVIIDESHEDSYKSEKRPRYHAREIAQMRCRLENAVLVLGSATPSLEDYHKARQGEYHLVEMKHRVDKQILPDVKIIDMRQELAKGNRNIFSLSLYSALKKTLESQEQAILLMNRRGYAQFVSCRSCGEAIKCDKCDITLTYHKRGNKLVCHYCGLEREYPKVCPNCKSSYIKHFGLGTQRVEEELLKLFPSVRLLRMDLDTTSRKGAHHDIIEAFGSGRYDILIGTQMVAKGLDFPNVTLVGVIAADTALSLPDYRSSEKTFQLITQVAGRAGRGSKPGLVLVQTYQPDHYSIRLASKHDYKEFYNREIEVRRQFIYPPYSHIIRVLISAADEKGLINYANDMLEWTRGYINRDPVLRKGLVDIGAYPAPIERINNKYRWHIIIKIDTSEETISGYHRLAETLTERFRSEDFSTALDFNPLSLL